MILDHLLWGLQPLRNVLTNERKAKEEGREGVGKGEKEGKRDGQRKEGRTGNYLVCGI